MENYSPNCSVVYFRVGFLVGRLLYSAPPGMRDLFFSVGCSNSMAEHGKVFACHGEHMIWLNDQSWCALLFSGIGMMVALARDVAGGSIRRNHNLLAQAAERHSWAATRLQGVGDHLWGVSS